MRQRLAGLEQRLRPLNLPAAKAEANVNDPHWRRGLWWRLRS